MLRSRSLRDPLAQLVETLDAERAGHALRRAEGVDEHRHLEAVDLLEEEGDVLGGRALRDAVDDLADLEIARDTHGDALELPSLLEQATNSWRLRATIDGSVVVEDGDEPAGQHGEGEARQDAHADEGPAHEGRLPGDDPLQPEE